MRADVWTGALVSPSEGKDLWIFGLGGWAVERMFGRGAGGLMTRQLPSVRDHASSRRVSMPSGTAPRYR
jgi:hypothetical protein